MHSRKLLGVLGLVIIGVVGISVETYGSTYNVTPLGTLGGGSSFPTGINATGQVVGGSETVDGNIHGFLYSSGIMHDFGTFGGTMSMATGVNASGQVSGYAYLSGNNAAHAFRYSNGTMQDLGTLAGPESYAYGINATGQVVGEANPNNNSNLQAFVYSGSTMQILGPLGNNNFRSLGTGINASGQIVGMTVVVQAGFPNHAFLYSNGTYTDLGTFGGTNSYADSINDAGQIVGGFVTSNNLMHAFLYDGGKGKDLGTLSGTSSRAKCINNNGEVVGYFQTADYKSRGFIYRDGIMEDLNNYLPSGSGWTITSADAISDNGWIAVTGSNPSVNGGIAEALLLTPVPEPGALGILTLGMGALLVRRRTK